ncbi:MULTISPECIES: N-acetyltransferase [unclassified Rathayibacter]|jgi:ribosomal protein S18 acetylase RimI-like enzyme|uniref:GNAT family N-acetyltransferase n=1 Tax=unclassified Rathayibacter TaxID=2609250 RepID=UPI000CE749CE|nr:MULTISPECIES: GNAT family N-acetyltransferase [unclassified Rathayibacter]PPF48268.1 GNAT family N-acetyltransferase [Rathayibacter sp. AY1A1]PPG85233.1 GNAT family N-acetyltransferase [Rathayibacter sp. AY1H2]PPH02285.1 GNAT family N-acetyltransferase [Rathayibacter sp. AY1G9]PPH37917.1 GNAT family N-acetyltransferase [Rathayibacter sp. AY1E3]PPH84511.1 GNAT family N-acetyltransferase [Rathayibacter sp. AY1D9]
MTVTLEPMPAAALAAWMRVQRSAYIEDRMRAGDDEAAATRNADASYEKYFPGGSPAAGHDVLLVSEDGRAVGSLWLGPHPSGLEGVGYVWDVQIDAAERGRGLGRAAMLLAESHVRSRGGSALALNVFGFNTAARALYESLGYETTSLQMRKPLA